MAAPDARVAALVGRGVAACNLIAFASYGSQIQGLNGHDGVLPADLVFDRFAALPWSERLWQAPTLWWLWPSDHGLHALCALGAAASFVALVGVAPGPCLLACAVAYASIATVAQDFMHLQWDSLIVEVTFATAFLVPWRARPALVAPSPFVLAAVRFTAFRLMWVSGLVKLRSGDATWHDLTALRYHYWTQPLPNPLSPRAHALSADAQWWACAIMFAIELAAPFLLLGPPAARRLAVALFGLLLGGLFATGNYGFFQLLSYVVCLAALDDDAIPGLHRAPVREPHPIARGATGLVGIALIALQAITLTGQLLQRTPLPEEARQIAIAAAPFRITSRYGLFATMTTDRPELVFEGSADGTTWKPYELPYKPGDVDRALPIVAPHMPRLDWQLWFAALDTCDGSPFVRNVMFGLQEGSPDVLSLFATNPFPDEPPAYVRVRKFRYTFTDAPADGPGAVAPGAAAEVGRVWTRVLVDPAFCPIVSDSTGRR